MTDLTFRQLVDDHYDRIFRAARFMTGSTQAAEDLVQETFLAAAESLRNFQGRSSAYTWLYGILHNKFRRWIRRKNVPVVQLPGATAEDDVASMDRFAGADQLEPGRRAERREAAGMVRDAIEGLSATHRAIVTMRYVEGLSYREIARLVGCPIGTVKSRIHYALNRIGDELARAGLMSE